MANPLGLIVMAAMLLLGYVLATDWSVRQRARRRLFDDEAILGAMDEGDASRLDEPLARWLAKAGYRGQRAPTWFVAATVGGATAGLIAGQAYGAFFQQTLVENVTAIPGGTGDIMAEILRRGALIVFVLMTIAPTLVVRARRRARVIGIEQDLPLALEMFATMAEAGLSFDAALARIVRARTSDRPLASELIGFQVDMLAGMPRIQALRQLARRADVPSLSTFATSLIQAEQVGASIAETLQHQANDLRSRRREDALLQAQALPVKLVFPLVICFLPGIFVSTLAPVLYQMIQVTGNVLRAGQ